MASFPYCSSPDLCQCAGGIGSSRWRRCYKSAGLHGQWTLAATITDSPCARWLADHYCLCHSHPQKGLLRESCNLQTNEPDLNPWQTVEPVIRVISLWIDMDILEWTYMLLQKENPVSLTTESLEGVNKQKEKGDSWISISICQC